MIFIHSNIHSIYW